MHAYDPRAQSGAACCIGHDHAVILVKHPLLGSIVRAGQQAAQRINRVHLRHVAHWLGVRGFHPRPVIFRRTRGQFGQRQIRHYFVSVQDQESVFGDGFAHYGKIKVPFVEHGFGFGLFLGPQHHQHAFLAF